MSSLHSNAGSSGSNPFERNHYTKCKNLYHTLLLCNDLHDKRDPPGFHFVHFLFKTGNCDDITDLSILRDKYDKYITKDDPKRLERILNYDARKQDEQIMTQAFYHYYTYNSKQILNTFNIIERIPYYSHKVFSFIFGRDIN